MTVTNNYVGGPETLVNTYTNNDQYDPQIAVLSGGGYVITWQGAVEDGSGFGIFAQRYDNAGSPVGAEFQVNTTTANWQQEPQIVALAGGGFVIVWDTIVPGTTTGLGVFSQQYDASGNKVGGEVTDNTNTPGNQWQQGVTALTGGGYVVSWAAKEGSEFDQTFTQLFDKTGAKVGTEIKHNTGFSGDPGGAVALNNGDYIVEWSDLSLSTPSQTFWAQHYTSGGQAVGGAIQLQALGDVAATANGYMIKTTDAGGVHEQAYDYTNQAVGSSVTVKPMTLPSVGGQTAESVAYLPGGGYLAAYTGATISNSAGLFVQQYDASGNAVGPLITVMSGSLTNGDNPGLAVLSDGSFVVTYSKYITGAYSFDVEQRHYTIQGEIVTGTAGNDLLQGSSQGDTLIGADGNDTLIGGAGADSLDGGNGFNLASYATATTGVTASLINPAINTGDAAGDVYTLIQGLIGSAYNDHLIGDAGNNSLMGGDGNDTLEGGAGNNVLDGGTGDNTAVFAFASTAATLLAYNGTVFVEDNASGAVNMLTNIQHLQFSDKTLSPGTATAFDPYEYLASNPSLIPSLGANPTVAVAQYLTTGAGEGLATHSFDAMEYLASNPDLIQAFGANPLAAEQHYVVNGYNEHRATTSFDAWEYLASNSDLIKAFGANAAAAEQHYVADGYNEHRATHTFDAWEYLDSNPDLIKAFGANAVAAEQHYVAYGFNEHRATSTFNAWEYLASNTDLIKAFGTNTAAAEQHYAAYGYNEHRATASFDPWEYLASNADLIQAFGTNINAAEQHYVANGYNEHRAINSFDALEYIASNPDLIRAFGDNVQAAEQHYVAYGFNEHRATHSFNAAQYLANYPDLQVQYGNNLQAAELHYILYGYAEHRTDQAPH